MINCWIKKSIVFTIILFCIGFSFSQSFGIRLKDMSLTSSNRYSILFVGGSGPGNYSKIQDAIDDASDGDIILVFRGVFYENLYIDKKIFLFGEDKDSTIIDGSVKVGEPNIMKMNSNSDVVYVFSADSLYISDFSIRNGETGINLENSTSTSIIDCNIYSNNLGVRLNDLSYNLIHHCNVFKNLNDGIQFYNSSNNNVKKSNIFLNKKNGVCLEYSIYNTFDGCNISNNKGKNIWLKYYSNNNIIINCNINKGYSGLGFETFSDNNLIYHNNFVRNKNVGVDNAYDECDNIWDSGNVTGGNYWDDYNGTDDNGDGIGDTPYYITGGASQDRYPLMSPAIEYDIRPPVVKISKPIKGLYILDFIIRRYLIRRPLIIGKITIEVTIKDDANKNFNIVKFYIDGKLKKIDTTPPYDYIWERDRVRIFGHRHTIDIVVFDQSGNRGVDNIKAWKFL